jgi:hypothetical protein
MIALAALAAAVAALLVLLELRDRRAAAEREVLRAGLLEQAAAHRDQVAELTSAHAAELASARNDLAKLAESHRQEMAALNQARCEEVASLCQRIQSPQSAVAAYAAADAGPDQPSVTLDDDEDYWKAANERMDQLARDLEGAGAPEVS